jgi:hypothetical protein
MESNQELFASEHPRIDNDKHGGLVHPIFPPIESEMLVQQDSGGPRETAPWSVPARRGGWPASRHATGKRRPDIAVDPADGERAATATTGTSMAPGPGRDYVRRTHTTVTWLGTWSYFGSTMRQATTPVHDT